MEAQPRRRGIGGNNSWEKITFKNFFAIYFRHFFARPPTHGAPPKSFTRC